jgi:hypothetical protein
MNMCKILKNVRKSKEITFEKAFSGIYSRDAGLI